MIAQATQPTHRTLLPCPFCGGEPKTFYGGPGNFFVECQSCGSQSDDGNEERIRAAWNKRADTALAEPPAQKPVAALQQSMRDAFEAMCAMRDAINEYLPMPSLESDLLKGPETSVFCAAVAEAVIAAVTAPARVADEQLARAYVLGLYDPEDDQLCDLQDRLRSKQAPTVEAPDGARVQPLQTAPYGRDAMLPSHVDVHEGAWAWVIGTNGKKAGWIDTHALFANQLYRDQILPARAEQREAPGEAVGADLRRELEWTAKIAEALLAHTNPALVNEGHAQQWYALHDQAQKLRHLAAAPAKGER